MSTLPINMNKTLGTMRVTNPISMFSGNWQIDSGKVLIIFFLKLLNRDLMSPYANDNDAGEC